MSQKLSRRELLRLGLGTTLAAPLLHGLAAGESANGAPVGSNAQSAQGAKLDKLPMRVLGQTGQRVTVFGLGGASSKTPLSNGPHDQAVAIVNRALDLGVNYFDTATTYGNGKSERALGEVARSRRREMFLASKTDARDYDGAMRELEASLKRLQTDHLDLWQMHHVSFAERDTTPSFAANGAIKAIEKAKSEKIIRFAGVTGHHRTDVLADWLRRHPFDTLLAALNAADVHQPDSFIRNLLPVARERKAGVIAMKVPAYGALLN